MALVELGVGIHRMCRGLMQQQIPVMAVAPVVPHQANLLLAAMVAQESLFFLIHLPITPTHLPSTPVLVKQALAVQSLI